MDRFSPTQLQNRYFAVRHAVSVANAEHRIVSTRENGVQPQWGLTDQGFRAARSLGVRLGFTLAGEVDLTETRVVFYVSPFTRAQDTANAMVTELRVRYPRIHVSCHTTDALCERNFGTLELESDANYKKVWEEDAKRAPTSKYGAEPVESVWARVRGLVTEHEAGFMRNTVCFLVAHGDVLQIAEAGFRGTPLHEHRSLPHLTQAECRELTSANDGSRLVLNADGMASAAAVVGRVSKL